MGKGIRKDIVLKTIFTIDNKKKIIIYALYGLLYKAQKIMTTVDFLWPKKIITGPVIIYHNTKNEILSVIEREDRPRKKQWQFFLPAGKKRHEEPDDMIPTALRETEEEAWIPRRTKEGVEILKSELFKNRGVVVLETEKQQLQFTILEYQEKLPQDILETYNKFFKQEIIQRAFLNIFEILKLDNSQLRPWVMEILDLFYSWDEQEIIEVWDCEYSPKDYNKIRFLKEKIGKKAKEMYTLQ